MENVFFKPWIGKDYDSGGIFNKKILVLGDNIVLNKFKKKKKEVDIMAKNAYISRVSYQLVY